MRPKSLLDIMNRMARRHEVLRKRQERRFPGRALPDSLDMFISIDSLLAHLYKQLLDATAFNNDLAHRRGGDDPMAVVAADMEDSARSAVAARLIELRADKTVRRRVAKMLRAARRENKKESRRLMEKKEAVSDRKKKAEDSFAMTMFLYQTLWHAVQATQRALSLARDFGAVAGPARRAV